MTDYNVYCDFGNKHPLVEGRFLCNCERKYGFMAISFKMFMSRVKGKIYETDYTEDDRMEFQEVQRQKGKLLYSK